MRAEPPDRLTERVLQLLVRETKPIMLTATSKRLATGWDIKPLLTILL